MSLWKSLSQRSVLIEVAERIRQLEESEDTLSGLNELRQWLGELSTTQAIPTPQTKNEEFGRIQADVLEILAKYSDATHSGAGSRWAYIELDRRLKKLEV